MDTPDHDAVMHSENHQPAEPVQEVALAEKETMVEVDQATPKKRGKKRRGEATEANEVKKKKNGALTASSVERPSRERKTVVRFAASAPRIFPVAKGIKIEQGSGEKLKDIPNVTFKILKRKSDENLRVFHTILFGRKTKAHYLKRNILQFSGFVWSQNKEKDRSRIREKLNKCNKDRLLDFCELLDVYVLKTATKKEDVAAKLLEFLESPHATREVVLSEKSTKGKKRRHVVKGNDEKRIPEAASSDKEKLAFQIPLMVGTHRAQKKPAKSHKKDPLKINSANGDDESKDKEETADLSTSKEKDGDGEPEASQSSESQLDGKSDGDEMDDCDMLKSEEKSPAGRKIALTYSKKGSTTSPSKKIYARDKTKGKVSLGDKASKEIKGSVNSEKKRPRAKNSKNDSSITSSQKKGKAGSISEGLLSTKKSKEMDKSNGSSKEKVKKVNFESPMKEEKQNLRMASKNKKDAQVSQAKSKNAAAKKKGKQEDASDEPSTEQLHSVVSEILREVDFNVATLADIIKQLGAHFNADLMHRKAEIKGILEVVINNMTDDEEEEDGDAAAEED